MKEPLLKDDAFLAQVLRAREDKDRVHVWWLGQSGFLVQWNGRHLLFDPYLSDSLTRKYAGTDKPHVRMTGRVVDPARLGFVDVVTSSHNHTDHLDAETLQPLMRANPAVRVVVAEANRQFAAERLGVGPETLCGLDAGHSAEIAGFKITAIPSAHETVEKDELGRCRFAGFVAEFGGWTIYHSGDTVRYDGMIEWLRRWQIDLMLLPINGRNPARRVAGNLDGPEAALLAKEAGARLVIPCHYDMFEFNTADAAEFIAAAARLGQACRVLRCGEGWTSAGQGGPSRR